MARFYVGQRVRIVRGEGGVMRFVGVECRVTDPDCLSLLRERSVRVDLDDGFWCFPASYLEPLVDPGRQVVSWGECLWQPEHIRETSHTPKEEPSNV